MALKTFNVDDKAYKRFSDYCKREGLSMSKKIDNFMKAELEKLGINSDKEIKQEKSEIKEHSFRKYC